MTAKARLKHMLRQARRRMPVSRRAQDFVLAGVYTAQTDVAHTLDGLRRSHESALQSLRQTQEASDMLAQSTADLTLRLADLVREVYGPGVIPDGGVPGLVSTLSDGQRVLVNTVYELAVAPGTPNAEAGPAPVAVVIPTCDRPQALDQAVHSACRQTRTPARVLVVNDGQAPVEDVIHHHADHLPSLELLTTPHPYSGGSVARNIALDALQSEHAVYLDDDNLLWPTWVATVEQALRAEDGPAVVYGAQIRGDVAAHAGLLYRPYSADALARDNFIDTNVLAHRTTSLRWSPTARRIDDWDFVLSLAATTQPVAIPHLASIYRDASPGRVSDAPGFALWRSAVRVKHGYSGSAHSCPVCGQDVHAWRAGGACEVCGSLGWERSAALLFPYLWDAGLTPELAEPSPLLDAVLERPAVEGGPRVTLGPAGPVVALADLPSIIPEVLVRCLGLVAIMVADRPEPDPLHAALTRDAALLGRYLTD